MNFLSHHFILLKIVFKHHLSFPFNWLRRKLNSIQCRAALIRVDILVKQLTAQFNTLSLTSFDWPIRIRVEKKMRITCVFKANWSSWGVQLFIFSGICWPSILPMCPFSPLRAAQTIVIFQTSLISYMIILLLKHKRHCLIHVVNTQLGIILQSLPFQKLYLLLQLNQFLNRDCEGNNLYLGQFMRFW